MQEQLLSNKRVVSLRQADRLIQYQHRFIHLTFAGRKRRRHADDAFPAAKQQQATLEGFINHIIAQALRRLLGLPVLHKFHA